MIVATYFKQGDLVMVDGNIETVRTSSIDRVYTEESIERGGGWGYFPGYYDPAKVILLETVEQAQEHAEMMEEHAMYQELSQGM